MTKHFSKYLCVHSFIIYSFINSLTECNLPSLPYFKISLQSNNRFPFILYGCFSASQAFLVTMTPFSHIFFYSSILSFHFVLVFSSIPSPKASFVPSLMGPFLDSWPFPYIYSIWICIFNS